MAVLTSPFDTQRKKSVSGFIIGAGVAVALLYFGRDFMITLVTAITISFLLDPFVALFMKIRLPRALASFLVCSFALALVYLLGLGAYTQVESLVREMPKYSQRINELVDTVAQRVELAEKAVLDVVVPRRVRQNQPEPPLLVSPKGRNRRTPAPETKPPAPAVQEVRIQEVSSPVFSYIYANIGYFYKVLLLVS
ncbi:MAG: AI-2E family transporter, partial [Bryobacteraceae bacterium]